jgi:phosphate starvation-inducible protein PhoH
MMPLPQSAELFYGLTLSEEQKTYADSIFDYKLTITDSISGSGKTTIAVGCAKILKKPLYYFFSPVQESVFGFTPGDEEDKQSKYLLPLLDALRKIGETPEKVIFSKKEFRPHAWVHATSWAFWRGGNIENATVIIDESQNWTTHQLKMILTRCHDTCTVIMIGHQGQIDIKPELSGFSSYIEHAKPKDFVNQVDLTKDFRGVLARWADLL